MAAGPEAYFLLKCNLATSHAQMCISHYIVGIGDRHLSNHMIDKTNGKMVGIDFGHAFGSATQVSQGNFSLSTQEGITALLLVGLLAHILHCKHKVNIWCILLL